MCISVHLQYLTVSTISHCLWPLILIHVYLYTFSMHILVDILLLIRERNAILCKISRCFKINPCVYRSAKLMIDAADKYSKCGGYGLTHWGRVTHICVSDLTSIGSDNGLSPELPQAIIRTKAGILLIWPLGTNFSEILIEIQTFSLKKMRLKMSSAKCCSFRLGLNVLMCFVISDWHPAAWVYSNLSRK